MTGARPRGVCRTCGKEYALTKNGRLRWHAGWRNVGVYCNGSGSRPLKVPRADA